ncbi:MULTISPECIES: hypothetical protein [unclassified Leisingera]|nr:MULTISPECIES: hypothetical protein [unclassified Leisingera]MCF6432473.1 hypothetical protein [Leisingera sp. MMG026]
MLTLNRLTLGQQLVVLVIGLVFAVRSPMLLWRGLQMSNRPPRYSKAKT